MKLISVNIEDHKHLERVIPFIEREKPDVLCMQEMLSVHVSLFEQLGFECAFRPMTRKEYEGNRVDLGIAFCTRRGQVRVDSLTTTYYRDPSGVMSEFAQNDIVGTVNNCVLFADVEVEGESFTLGTTHFTWTPDGSNPSEEQREDVQTFITLIQKENPHLMCGDFNIPRNINPLYASLIKHYTDEIPPQYQSSLDPSLHKLSAHPAKKHLFDSFMVDYLFSQPPYIASDVRLEFCISDHAAIIATVSRGK